MLACRDWGATGIEEALAALNIPLSLQECIHALEKQPEARTEQDLQAIGSVVEPQLMRNAFFAERLEEFSSEERRFISGRLRFEFYAEGEKVVAAGDFGDKFYIIIQGAAAVLVPIAKKRGEIGRDKQKDVEQKK